MIRWRSAVLLAFLLALPDAPAAADQTEDIQKLTQQIDAGAQKGPALADLYRERGSRRLMDKDVAGALADYDKAVAAAPKFAAAYVDRSFGRSEAGDLAHAIDDLSQALALGMDDPAGGYYFRAELRARTKDFAGALADYDQAIAHDANFGHAYIGRGLARMETGDTAGAQADLDHAVNGKGALYHYSVFRLQPNLAVAFTKMIKQQTGMDVGVSSDPEVPAAAYLARGRLWLAKSDYARARPDLDAAVAKDFKNPDVWIYRGLENLALHRCWDGEHDLGKAAELMDKEKADLIKANRDFIAKTPCAEDLLE
jgi:tetratricopeptide (TPR) repeat protein